MSLCCQQDDRRDAVRRATGRNGLDYVEVGDDQLTLTAFFLGKLPPELAEEKPGLESFLRIEGGQRVTDIRIVAVKPVPGSTPGRDDQLVVTLDRYGDFSTYTLRLVGMDDIDPRYDHVDFSFKINCPSDLDCAPTGPCEPTVRDEPEISYLAKDYASFRRLILDRLALLVPAWKERHVPDLGIALVELLAYAGDHLSYFQDAVGTEAYLDTARLRISVRRHARLVDYRLHEGCNARAWVCLQTDTDFALDPSDVAFATGIEDTPLAGKSILQRGDLQKISPQAYEVFEPLRLDAARELQFYAAHSEIHFYTWGGKQCCLEGGSTTATLIDGWEPEQTRAAEPPQTDARSATPSRHRRNLHLQAGNVLILEEVIGSVTGNPADADLARRHAVRLTRVTPGTDLLFHQPIVEIEWADEDALPFPFCLSAITAAPACRYITNVTVARGNVLLVDHGRTTGPEDLGVVPTLRKDGTCECADHPGDVRLVPGKFQPALAGAPVTFRQDPPKDFSPGTAWVPADELVKQDPRKALPQITLHGQAGQSWNARYDLIKSQPSDRDFVVEIDDDGAAQLRFGDGELGYRPPAGMSFAATYRIGNGTRGNVGAGTITRLVLNKTTLSGLTLTTRNPLAAHGGTDPEPVAQAKLIAPHAFRDPQQIERAIIADDYAVIAGRDPKVQRAAAALVWTGSWYEADVAIDPLGGEGADDALIQPIAASLEAFRRMGHDLHVLPARYVPLDLALEICALPLYQRAHVKAALLDAFSNRRLPGGQPGFFHPDNLTFGEGVFLSRIIATAQRIAGVGSVTVTRFQRLFESANREIENGLLPLRTDEIAQLDNDPTYPERGRLEIVVKGGR